MTAVPARGPLPNLRVPGVIAPGRRKPRDATSGGHAGHGPNLARQLSPEIQRDARPSIEPSEGSPRTSGRDRRGSRGRPAGDGETVATSTPAPTRSVSASASCAAARPAANRPAGRREPVADRDCWRMAWLGRRARDVQRRSHPERDGRRERHQHGESQHGRVESHLVEPWERLAAERAQHVHAESREHEAEHAAEDGEQHALDQKLTDDARAGRSRGRREGRTRVPVRSSGRASGWRRSPPPRGGRAPRRRAADATVRAPSRPDRPEAGRRPRRFAGRPETAPSSSG